MSLNQNQSGFDLGEKWRDKLILRDSNGGGGVGVCNLVRRECALPLDFTSTTYQPKEPIASVALLVLA